MPKNIKCLAIFFMCVCVFVLCGLVSPARAEPGDGGDEIIIHVYHDYYIPWVTGADNCYGSYRVALQTAVHTRSTLDGTVTITPEDGTLPGSRRDGFAMDGQTLYRDDVYVLTDFALQAYKETTEYAGNIIYIHHHTYYYETPDVVAGLSIDADPIFGSSAMKLRKAPVRIALSRKNIYPYFQKNMSEKEMTVALLPTFDGANPRGKIVRKKQVGRYHYKYILSLSHDHPEMAGWWRLFGDDIMVYVDNMRNNPAMYMITPTAEQREAAEFSRRQALREAEAARAKGLPSNVPSYLTEPFDWKSLNFTYGKHTLSAVTFPVVEHAERAHYIYWYDSPFLDSHAISKVWEKSAKNIADSVATKIKKPETETHVLDMSPASGFSLGSVHSEKKYVPKKYEKVVGDIQDSVITTPFGPSNFDMFRSLFPGTWVSKGDGDGHAIYSMHPDTLARWPYAFAQTELYNERKTSVDRLNAQGMEDGAVDTLLSSSGGMLGFMGRNETQWRIPRDNILGDIVTVPTHDIGVKDPSVIAPFQSISKTKSLFDMWAHIDRPFYDSIMPYLSMDLGLFYFVHGDGLFMDKAIEKTVAPRLYYSSSRNINTTYKVGDRDLENMIPNAYFPIPGDTIDSAGGFKKVVKNKEAKLGQVHMKGHEFLSNFSRANVKYVPVDYEKAQETLRNVGFVRTMLNQGVLRMPKMDTHVEVWDVFPVDGTEASLSVWPAPRCE